MRRRRDGRSEATLGLRATLSDAEKHLARCRRRREDALVFAVRMPAADDERVGALAGAVRLTDGLGISGRVVHGVIEANEESRAAISRRLLELGLTVRWSRFPADGLTLPALIDAALEGAPTEHGLARKDGRGERIVYEVERA